MPVARGPRPPRIPNRHRPISPSPEESAVKPTARVAHPGFKFPQSSQEKANVPGDVMTQLSSAAGPERSPLETGTRQVTVPPRRGPVKLWVSRARVESPISAGSRDQQNIDPELGRNTWTKKSEMTAGCHGKTSQGWHAQVGRAQSGHYPGQHGEEDTGRIEVVPSNDEALRALADHRSRAWLDPT